LSTEDQWAIFFRDAKNWSELPEQFNTPELRQAMATLQRFSEKERDYHLYQARENAIREEKTQQALLEEALRMQEEERRAKEIALMDRERERKAKEAALLNQEKERRAKELERKAKEIALMNQERERKAKEIALLNQESERQAKEAAITEQDRLRELLKKSGIDPDA
jgi:hypothetical protein